MSEAEKPRQAAAGRIGAWARRSLNPLRMPGDVFSTLDTASIEREVAWAKAGHAALLSRTPGEIPLVRGDKNGLDEEASIESVRRYAIAANADGELAEEALQEVLAMTPRQFRSWCRLERARADRRSVFYFVLSGLAVLVAVWSVLVVGSPGVGRLAGFSWVLLALLTVLYGWRERRDAQGRVWRPVAEIAGLFR